MTKTLNIGMIGYGFMAKAHSNAWRRVADFFPALEHRPVLKAVAARTADKVSAFADVWGYESVETDWQRLIARADIDLIDICVPNRLHKEIALAAAAAGKWICCEKPLAMNAAEGEAMVAAVERAGVPNMVWYNYRRVPAITLARQLIDEGRIGRPYHYRAQFLQDWTIAPGRAPGRHGALAPRRARRGLGRHRRSARPQHRHRDVAERPDRARHGRDRDLREGAPAPGDRQGRAGRHRRRLHGHGALRERRHGAVREHALRARPQGAEDAGAERRGTARCSSTCTTRSGSRSSSTARPTAKRSTATPPAGARSTSPISSTRTWTTGGSRA